MKQKLLLLIASIAITFFALELFLYLLWSNPYANTRADCILKLRIHHKNLDMVFDRQRIDSENRVVRFRTDHRGYIKPVQRFANPELKIAFLGGSTTECIAVQEEKRFPFLVSRLLEAKNLNVNCLNAARSGGTSHDSLNILLNHVALDKPDVVVMMHATNDFGVLRRDNDYQSRMGHDVSPRDVLKYKAQIASRYSSIISMIRRALTSSGFQQRQQIRYQATVISDVQLEAFRSRLMGFVGLCDGFGFLPVLMTQPIAANVANEMTPEWMDPNAQAVLNQTIRDVTSQTTAELIDLEVFLAETLTDEESLHQVFYDAMHVTDYGSALYAEYISTRLYQILQDMNLFDTQISPETAE